jgi:Uma2 family endonuclease
MLALPAPTLGHQLVVAALLHWFHEHGPAHLRQTSGIGLAVTANSTYEPDVLVYPAEYDRDRHYLMPHEVRLVVEVVCRGTRRRDRFEKPGGYAAAGIKNYWRVEQEPVHVYAYQLGADGQYKLIADSAEELVVDEPFPIRLPIGEITP